MKGLTWREQMEHLWQARDGLEDAARALEALGDADGLREMLLDAQAQLNRRAGALQARCEARELAEERALEREYFRGCV